MIPAETALEYAATRRPKDTEPVELTDEETVAFRYIEYTIDRGIVDGYSGQVFDIKIPVDVAKTPGVIAALKRQYEKARWSVGVFPIMDGENIVAFQLVFAAKEVTTVERDRTPLPILVPSGGEEMKAEKRLLVRMPTRSRPAQAVEVLAKYKSMAGMPIIMEVVIDYDDPSITSEVLYRFHQLGCIITYGAHKSKIEACNGGRVNEWDILVLASDDMHVVQENWAVRICELFEEHWPLYEGCLHLDDGYAHDRVATISIMGKRWYRQVGEVVYHSSYKSLFSDDDHTEFARKMNRIVYVPEVLIEHRHPAAGKGEHDPLYSVNDKHYFADKETYEARLARGFDAPPVLLSILICTFPQRRGMLERFVDYLEDQIAKAGRRLQVEIVIDHKPAPSLGEKRQRLLDRAIGAFTCFVDDDDLVSHDYIARICDAIEANPKADCVSFVGTMLTAGNRPERFEHSLKHRVWVTREDGVMIRSPNHLSPIRTSIAKQVGFQKITYAEDHMYSKEVLPLLHVEADAGDDPMYMYFFEPKDMPTGSVR